MSMAYGPSGEVLVVTGPDGTLTQYSLAGAFNLTQMLGLAPARSAAVAFAPYGEVLGVTGRDGSVPERLRGPGQVHAGAGPGRAGDRDRRPLTRASTPRPHTADAGRGV